MKPHHWLLWLCIFLGINPSSGWAQPSDVSFQHFTTDQGLSNDQVTAVLKDRQGFMWFGTVNGLNRFDGVRFTVYKRTERPDGLPGNYIVGDGLSEDRDGFIWVSTHRGLCRYNPQTNRFQAFPLPQQRDQVADNDFVSPVRFDKSGMGWFASVDRLYRLEPHTGRITAFPVPIIIPGVFSIPISDNQGHIWMQSGGALYRFNPTTQRYSYYLGVDEKHPKAPSWLEVFRCDQDGQQYAVMGHGEVLRYDAATDQFIHAFSCPNAITNVASAKSADGRLFYWLGGLDRLTIYQPAENRFTDFTHVATDPLSYPGGTISFIQVDQPTGVVWFGSSEGIIKIDPNALKFGRKWLPTLYMGSPDPIEMVCQDFRDDNLYWILSHHRLYSWNRLTSLIQQIPNAVPLANQLLYTMLQDDQGRLWIGMGHGVAIYNPATKQWQRKQVDNTTDPQNDLVVTSLSQHLGERIWIGTFNGLFWCNSAMERIQPWPFSGLPKRIGQLQTNSPGQLWVQTRSGLFRVNPASGQTKRIYLHGSANAVQPSDQVHSTFFLDRHDHLWISGIDFLAQADTNGLIRQTYTLTNGLLADHVFDITEDKRGHFWLATDEQLHELDPLTRRFRYYNKTNGLFANTQSRKISQDRQGTLFTGFFGAFSYWQPDQLRQNTLPPPVVITQLRVNNQRRPVTSTLALKPDDTSLSIDFAALNFSQPEKNRYAYQLVDFDKNWVTTNDRTATYTNLEPGTYTFRVKASNNDGVWNETGASLAIQVIPPYWKTSWFRLLIVLLVVCLLYAIYQYRRGQRQRLEKIRNRIATDLHDDMGSTLSSIRIFSDVVQQQIAPTTPEAVPILQRISNSATTLSESMQDIIWTIQTKNDRLDDVVTRMREFGLKMAEAKGIAFTMDVSDQFEKTRLNVEQRRNLYLIFKESINNAVKYANPSRIDVCLTVKAGKQLHLLIKDDGRGFDPATVQSGNGLPNLQKRAQEIKGKLTLTASPGHGTEIDLLTKL